MTCPGTHRGELKIHLLQLCLAPGSEFSRLGKETSSDQKSKKESALTGQSGVGEEILWEGRESRCLDASFEDPWSSVNLHIASRVCSQQLTALSL